MHDDQEYLVDVYNRVVLRIWTLKEKKGHLHEHKWRVSIETPYGYISLWPSKPVSFPEEYSNDHMLSYEEDKSIEGRDPEHVVCFYSLNPEQIQEEFNDLKNDFSWGWGILTNNALCKERGWRSYGDSIYSLLKRGRIDLLIDSRYPSIVSSVGSFDGLCKLIQFAKQEELKAHPKTANEKFKYEGETPIEILAQSSYCRIL